MAIRADRRPKFSKKSALLDSDDEEYLGSILKRNQNSKRNTKDDDDFSSLSFGTLNAAQKKLSKCSLKSLKRDESDSEAQQSSEEEGGFFEESSDDERPHSSSSKNQKKKSKHAPSESSAKRPVPKVRKIPGLESKTTLYTDIRFDTAYGKSDLERTRKNYAFLDEYRAKEISDMQDLLRANQKRPTLSNSEVEEINYKIQSLKSRMDTLKNRDLEKKVLKEFKDKHKGEGDFYLKRSDKRKLIQKAKFDNMKPKQREKVMERKRKKRLGKEFKQMEFM